jgi:hypothetical protein
MAQGFNPHRHRPSPADESRWARFSYADIDPLPTDPGIQRVLTEALRRRLTLMDRTKAKERAQIQLPATDDDPGVLGTIIEKLLEGIEQLDRTHNKQLANRIRLYIRVIALQDQRPDAWIHNCFRLKLGHWDDVFWDELTAIAQGKLTAFGCLPSVLRLQRDSLFAYMNRHYEYRAIVGTKGLSSMQISGDGYAHRVDSPKSWLRPNARRIHKELSFYRCSCQYHHDLSKLITDDSKGPGELIPAILQALHSGLSASSIRQVLKKTSRPGKIPSFLT